MRILMVLLLASLLLAGCTEPDADRDAESPDADAADASSLRVAYLAREVLTLVGDEPEAFQVEVPDDAGPLLVVITPQGGTYSGKVTLVGLGDCDDTNNSGGPASVDLGRHNGGGYGRCVLDPGTYDVLASIEAGQVDVDVDVLAVVP